MRNHIADDKIRTKEKYINNSLHLARKLQYIQKELFQYKRLRLVFKFCLMHEICSKTKTVKHASLPFPKVLLSCRSEDEPALSLDKYTRKWLAKILTNKDKVVVQSKDRLV